MPDVSTTLAVVESVLWGDGCNPSIDAGIITCFVRQQLYIYIRYLLFFICIYTLVPGVWRNSTGYPVFRAPKRCVPLLRKLGFCIWKSCSGISWRYSGEQDPDFMKCLVWTASPLIYTDLSRNASLLLCARCDTSIVSSFWAWPAALVIPGR